MKTLKLTAVIFTILLSALSINTFAQGKCGSQIPGLTDAQKEKIETLRTAHRTESQALSTKCQQASTDEEKAKFTKERNELRQKHQDEIRKLLNDEQKKYFDENIANRQSKKGNCGQYNNQKSDCCNKAKQNQHKKGKCHGQQKKCCNNN